MKSLRYAIVLSVWFVLCVSIAPNPSLFAQTPKGTPKTIVIRGNTGFLQGNWDGDKTLLYTSSEPGWGEDYICNNQPLLTASMDTLERIIASGKTNFFQKGPVYARIYYPVTLDDFFPYENLCNLLRTGQPAAEGIVHYDINIQNGGENLNLCELGLGPGRGSFIFRASGSLFNISMPCPGRQVSVNLEQHFHLKIGAYVDPDTCSTDPSNFEVIKYVMDVHCLN